MIVIRIYSIEYNVNTTLIIHVSKAVKHSCKYISCLIWIRPKQTKKTERKKISLLKPRKKKKKKKKEMGPQEKTL